MKTRIIQTRFWKDEFVGQISKEAKLVFMYLLTNPSIGLTGAYECPDKEICSDTGIKRVLLQEIKKELEPKILFVKGWVIIKNSEKYNDYTHQEKAYNKELYSLPDFIKECTTGSLLAHPPTTTGPVVRNQKLETRNQNKENTGEGLEGDEFFTEAVVEVPEGYKSLPDISPPEPEVAEGLTAFKGVNSRYKQLFQDLEQIEAMKMCFALHTNEEVMVLVKHLPKTNSERFMPKIYTPKDLLEKWDRLLGNLKSRVKDDIKNKVLI